MKAKREVWPREGISEMLVTYLPGWEWERLTLESGPDPVELLREVAAVLNGQEYVMPQVCERITDYLAAIGEE